MKLSSNIKDLILNENNNKEDEKDQKTNNKVLSAKNGNSFMKGPKRLTYISQKAFSIKNNNTLKNTSTSMINRNNFRGKTNKPKNLNLIKPNNNDPLLLLSEDSSSARYKKSFSQKKNPFKKKSKIFLQNSNKVSNTLTKKNIYNETFFTGISNIDNNNIPNKKYIVPKQSLSFGKIRSLNQNLYNQYQKELYEEIKLKNLKDEIYKFEISDKYQPDDKIIQENLSSPNTFINKKFLNKTGIFSLKMKDKNKYYENADLVKSKLRGYLKNFSYSKNNFPKLKKFYNKINKIKTYSEKFEFNFNDAKNDNYTYLRTNDVFNEALKYDKQYNDEVDETFKKYTLEYKKKMGDFTFYNGKGVFSGHVNTLANGDKIALVAMSGLSQFQK